MRSTDHLRLMKTGQITQKQERMKEMKEMIYSVLTDPLMQVAYWVAGAFVLLLVIGFVVVNRIYNRKVGRGELPKMSSKSPYDTFRVNQKVKALAIAVAVVAATSTAQAGGLFCPPSGEGSTGGSFWGNAWTWFTSTFGMDQFVQSAGSIGQNTPQAYSNVAGSAFSSAPVGAPNGPQAPAGGEGKWHSKNP